MVDLSNYLDSTQNETRVVLGTYMGASCNGSSFFLTFGGAGRALLGRAILLLIYKVEVNSFKVIKPNHGVA